MCIGCTADIVFFFFDHCYIVCNYFFSNIEMNSIFSKLITFIFFFNCLCQTAVDILLLSMECKDRLCFVALILDHSDLTFPPSIFFYISHSTDEIPYQIAERVIPFLCILNKYFSCILLLPIFQIKLSIHIYKLYDQPFKYGIYRSTKKTIEFLVFSAIQRS